MGVLDRLNNALAIKQTALPVETPTPRVEDAVSVTVAGEGHDFSSIRQLLQSEPSKIEYLFAQSAAWARTVARLRMETWRRGVRPVPTHDRYCVNCGQGQDGEVRDVGSPRPPEEALQCESCGGIEFRDADPSGKKRLEEFLADMNAEHESVHAVGSRKIEEQLKYGRGVIVYAFAYQPNEVRSIDRMVLKGVYAADPGKVVRLKRSNGRTGGLYVCVWCRGNPGYKASKAPGFCDGPGCGAPLYEAWFKESMGAKESYYLRNEVHETRWPYMDGSSPVTRLWTMANTIILMDWHAGTAVDPRQPKGLGKILVTMGGDAAAMEAWAKRQAETRKKTPNKFSHLHLPAPPGGLQDLKMGATVIDMTDAEFKAQLPELRKSFEDGIRNQYYVSEIQAGNSEGLGGLNKESQGMKSTGDVVEDLKEGEFGWLDRIPAYLGTDEWSLEFVEDEETSDAEDVLRQLEVAEKAAGLGLKVDWVGDSAHIKDGPVEKQASVFPPLGGGAPFGQALGAPSDDSRVPFGVQVVFDGQAGVPGAEAAEDALWAAYAGLTPEESQLVREEVARSLSQPQGWSLESVAARVHPILTSAGIDAATAAWRSRVIAATETRAAISEWQLRLFRGEEAERGKQFLYKDVGPDDSRTTKLSYWVREQVGDGKPLNEVTRILDEAVTLAVRGAFTDGGSLSSGPGQPVKLPPGFRRRGFLVHFGDRDRIVRAGESKA